MKSQVIDTSMTTKFTSFKEYLNKDGKTQEKPIVDAMADTAPEPTKSPPEAKTKGKGWEANVKDGNGKPSPYKAPGTEKKGIIVADGGEQGKGLADQGDKKLEYNPKVKENPTYSNWDTETSWPKTKTEDFIDRTKSMSLPEFAKHMIDAAKPGDDAPTVFAPREGRFRPNPYESVRYVAHLAMNNEQVMESLVMEFVRREGLPKLMEELFKHRKSYEEAVSAIDCDRFLNTIREMTSPPASETEGEEEEEKTTSSAKKQTMAKPAKGMNATSMNGGQLDMADSGVATTRASMRMKKK